MHFQANMTVRLAEPLPTVGLDGAPDGGTTSGYCLSMCVNAANAEEATAMASEVALCPTDDQGHRTRYNGAVEHADVFEIRKERLDPAILAQARNIDQPGVYMSTPLVFFHPGALEPPPPQKKWWQVWR